MSDPRIPYQNGAADPWGQPGPQQGQQPHPEPLGSLAHPQSAYSQSPYPETPYPVQYSGQDIGQNSSQPAEIYPPQHRYQARKPLPEPPAGLAAAAMVVACCVLFVELAELAILLVTANRGEAQGGLGAGSWLDPNGVALTGLFLLAAFLVVCPWLYASRKFAEAANPAARLARGPAWTWLGWWVPVVFLWFPYQVVRDIRNAVVPAGERRARLGLWWTCWLLFGLTAYSPASADLEVLVRSVAALTVLFAFVQWIRIVREITRGQEKLAGLG
jgi:hypothetical protein